MVCNMVTKPTGRDRNRPHRPLRKDPDCYWIARYVAECRIKGPGQTDRGIALAMTMVRRGALINDPENVAAFQRGGTALFEADAYRGNQDAQNARRRNTSAFHPPADDLARKARRLLNQTSSWEDTVWLADMSAAWAFALGASSFDMAYNRASIHCWKISETRFFERVLRPIVEHRFDRGPAPAFTAPDFFPHASA
jgi:hypothetical protein